MKGQWSAKEDAVLMKLASSGYKNWGVLSNHMPGDPSLNLIVRTLLVEENAPSTLIVIILLSRLVDLSRRHVLDVVAESTRCNSLCRYCSQAPAKRAAATLYFPVVVRCPLARLCDDYIACLLLMAWWCFTFVKGNIVLPCCRFIFQSSCRENFKTVS